MRQYTRLYCLTAKVVAELTLQRRDFAPSHFLELALGYTIAVENDTLRCLTGSIAIVLDQVIGHIFEFDHLDDWSA